MSSCQTGLANEEVVGGECDRCGTPVEKRNLKQWMLRITKYADRLLESLKDFRLARKGSKNARGLDWPQ